jgi:hypothetical protein
MTILNSATIDIDLQQQIDLAQDHLDSVTQGAAIMAKAKEEISQAREYALAAVSGLTDIATTLEQPHQAIMSALVAILRLNTENAQSMEAVMVANLNQYEKSKLHHQRQLDMFTEMKARVLADDPDPGQVQFPVQ